MEGENATGSAVVVMEVAVAAPGPTAASEAEETLRSGEWMLEGTGEVAIEEVEMVCPRGTARASEGTGGCEESMANTTYVVRGTLEEVG